MYITSSYSLKKNIDKKEIMINSKITFDLKTILKRRRTALTWLQGYGYRWMFQQYFRYTVAIRFLGSQKQEYPKEPSIGPIQLI